MLVVRSLVPRGLAAVDGRLTPGDRLLSVNEVSLEHCSLSYALHMMHSLVDGCRVRLRVAKPMRPLAAASLTAATATATATATAGAGASHESESPSRAAFRGSNTNTNALVNAAATSAQLAGALEHMANRSAASAPAPRGLLASTPASLHLAASSGRDADTNCDRLSPNPSQMAVLCSHTPYLRDCINYSISCTRSTHTVLYIYITCILH